MNLNAEETTIVSLSKIHSGRGIDGLSRYDREQSARYNRTQALLDKFLHTRKKEHTLQLTHTHILSLTFFRHFLSLIVRFEFFKIKK